MLWSNFAKGQIFRGVKFLGVSNFWGFQIVWGSKIFEGQKFLRCQIFLGMNNFWGVNIFGISTFLVGRNFWGIKICFGGKHCGRFNTFLGPNFQGYYFRGLTFFEGQHFWAVNIFDLPPLGLQPFNPNQYNRHNSELS